MSKRALARASAEARRAEAQTRALEARQLRLAKRITAITNSAIADGVHEAVVAGELLAAAAAISVVYGPQGNAEETRAFFVKAALARVESALDEWRKR